MPQTERPNSWALGKKTNKVERESACEDVVLCPLIEVFPIGCAVRMGCIGKKIPYLLH